MPSLWRFKSRSCNKQRKKTMNTYYTVHVHMYVPTCTLTRCNVNSTATFLPRKFFVYLTIFPPNSFSKMLPVNDKQWQCPCHWSGHNKKSAPHPSNPALVTMIHSVLLPLCDLTWCVCVHHSPLVPSGAGPWSASGCFLDDHQPKREQTTAWNTPASLTHTLYSFSTDFDASIIPFSLRTSLCRCMVSLTLSSYKFIHSLIA